MFHFKTAVILILLTTLKLHAVVKGKNISPLEKPEVGLLALYDHPLKNPISLDNLPIPERCTGIFISDSLMLTAGHCVRRDNNQESNLYLYSWKVDGSFILISPLEIKTRYIYEELQVPDDKSNIVPGCSVGQKPLPLTKTDDIALIVFPKGTSKAWVAIDPDYIPQKNDPIEFYGYSLNTHSFETASLLVMPTIKSLHKGESKIWRWNNQRLAMIALEIESFASDGDSGGPVIINGKLVAIISTISTKCDTEFGEDYAVQNTSTRLTKENLKLLGLPYY